MSNKPKTLFDHLKAITQYQDPNYWEKLSDADKKTFSNFMVHRFLSMNPDWVDIISDLSVYTQTLPPDILYKTLIGLIPKGRYFLKYVKGKKDEKYEPWLVELLVIDFSVSKKEALDYLEILYATREGRENIKYICEKYGIEKKQITKLKLKV